MSAQRAILWLAWLAQVLGGVLAFSLAADKVFVGLASDPVARQCLRLAVYGNLGAAVLSLGVLLRAPSHFWLRLLALAGLAYHLPAGVDGFNAAQAGGVLLPPSFGPALFHGVMAALLVIAALYPPPTGES